MGARGRRSSADLALKPVILAERRPAPPPGLTEAEQAIWTDVASALPAAWFSKASRPILAAYCRHVARGEVLAQQISEFDPTWWREEIGLRTWDRLLGMAERETRAATACARALRLTPQAQMHPRKAGTLLAHQPTIRPPWEGYE